MAALARLLHRLGVRTRRVGGLTFLYVGRWTVSLSRRRDGPDAPKPPARKRGAGRETPPVAEGRPAVTLVEPGDDNRGGNTP